MRILRALPALFLLVAGVFALTSRTAAADETITYEIGTEGDVSTDVDAFAAHVRDTLTRPEGWSLGGTLDFVPVERGGDLEILIAEPAEIGAIPGCSAQYSCHVSGTVYINEERWNEGAAGWGAGLDAYRHYVVTHEVGHYIGLDHVDCPGSGEPAPVMQQQTIETEPCVNRVWPLPDERDAAADRYGTFVADAAYGDDFDVVRSVYRRTLGRTPSSSVARDLAEAMDRKDLTTSQLVEAMFSSAEFDNRTRAIGRLYFAAFVRAPDVEGQYDWMSRMLDGRTLDEVAQAFADSQEYDNRYGDTSNEEYVELLYENVLNRSSDPQGKQNWVDQLESGAKDRGEVLVGFSESPEHEKRRSAEVDVALLYVTLLDRTGDPQGRENWEDQLESGRPRVEVIAGFVHSGESVV